MEICLFKFEISKFKRKNNYSILRKYVFLKLCNYKLLIKLKNSIA